MAIKVISWSQVKYNQMNWKCLRMYSHKKTPTDIDLQDDTTRRVVRGLQCFINNFSKCLEVLIYTFFL